MDDSRRDDADSLPRSRDDRMAGSRSVAFSSTRKEVARSPLILASVAVVAMATLAFQLIGTSVVAHFVVLLFYGAVFCAMGVLLGSPAAPAPTPAAALIAPSDTDRRSANNNGSVPNGLAASRESAPAPVPLASPLNWVGETVEGSINWLRFGGDASGVESRAGPRDGRLAVPARARSASAGGPLLSAAGNEGGGGGSAMSSPNVGGGRGGGGANDASPSGFPRGFGRAAAEAALGALPALGAGIPQGARSRVWSRTFGGGVGGSTVGGDDDESEGEDGAGAGTSVEDSSVVDRAGGDWIVGAGTVDGR